MREPNLLIRRPNGQVVEYRLHPHGKRGIIDTLKPDLVMAMVIAEVWDGDLSRLGPQRETLR
jgi:hypothetical protein